MTLEQFLILHPKKYLIFDLDETLAKLKIDWSTITRGLFELVATFDEPLTKQLYPKRFSAIHLCNTVVKKHGQIAQNILNAFVEEYEREHYSGYIPNTLLIEFIKSTKEQYSNYLWTTNTDGVISDFLNKENINGRFTKIISRKIVAQLKPEKDGFDLIYKSNTPLSDYILIGDSINDEGAAKNAGIDFFKIDYFTRHNAPLY